MSGCGKGKTNKLPPLRSDRQMATLHQRSLVPPRQRNEAIPRPEHHAIHRIRRSPNREFLSRRLLSGGCSYQVSHSCKFFEGLAIVLDRLANGGRDHFARRSFAYGREYDRAARRDDDVHLVADSQSSQIHQRVVEYQTLGIAHLRNLLEHSRLRKTMYYG